MKKLVGIMPEGPGKHTCGGVTLTFVHDEIIDGNHVSVATYSFLTVDEVRKLIPKSIANPDCVAHGFDIALRSVTPSVSEIVRVASMISSLQKTNKHDILPGQIWTDRDGSEECVIRDVYDGNVHLDDLDVWPINDFLDRFYFVKYITNLSDVEIRSLQITTKMTDSDVGYVLMPRGIAETLSDKKLIKIIEPSSYGEVKAVITQRGRAALE